MSSDGWNGRSKSWSLKKVIRSVNACNSDDGARTLRLQKSTGISDACSTEINPSDRLFNDTSYNTPRPALSWSARSSASWVLLSDSFQTFSSVTQRSQRQGPNPHSDNLRRRSLRLLWGLVYVIRSSCPISKSSFAITVMRESAVRWSKCLIETLGVQLWLRWECSLYSPPWASRSTNRCKTANKNTMVMEQLTETHAAQAT